MRRNLRKEAALLMGGVLAASVMNPFAALAAQATGPAAFLEQSKDEVGQASPQGNGSTVVITNTGEQNTPGAPGGPASAGQQETQPSGTTQPPSDTVTIQEGQQPEGGEGQLTEIPSAGEQSTDWKHAGLPYTGYETGDTSTEEHGQGVTMHYERGKGSNITNVSMTLDNMQGISAITYRTYVNVTYENRGLYLPYTLNGIPCGGTEDSTYLEAAAIQLTGDMAKEYDIWYAMTVSGYGKLGWAKNGELAGAMDIREHIISMDVRILPKGSEAPGSTDYRLLNQYTGRLVIADGATTCVNEDGSPYSGWVDQDFKKWYFENGNAVTGWRTIDGLQFYFAEDGQLVENVDDIIGKQSEYQIRVNKTLNCMTIYAKDENGNFVIPVKACLTSVGDDTPIGTFKTPEKYRWRLMVNDTYTQYATRITQGFLIHSPTYYTQNNKDVNIGAYNLMGQTRSLGCVRVLTGEAKWIYDRCKLGTEVVIYEDANVPGPFHIPPVIPVNVETKYDPTDPAFQ